MLLTQFSIHSPLVGNNTTVVSRSESSEDITSNYVDVESRKKALEIQQERLFALLEKAENMEDIIALEERISNVTYELESYISTLRNYDNLVDYSTVSLQIKEVERVSAPETTSTLEAMKNGFVDTMYNISDGFQCFCIWFVSNILYLIIWGAVIAVVIIVIRKKTSRKKTIKQLVMNKNINQDQDQ